MHNYTFLFGRINSYDMSQDSMTEKINMYIV